MAGVITTLIVSLCIGMVVFGVEGHRRWATECAVFFFALIPPFLSPNAQLVIYPFLLHTALTTLGERFIAARKKTRENGHSCPFKTPGTYRNVRSPLSCAITLLILLALVAWCVLRHDETQSNWPLLALFPAYILFRGLMHRNHFAFLILAFLLYFAAVLTLIPWSRQIKTDENTLAYWRNWKDYYKRNPAMIPPDIRYNTPPHILKPPTPTTNPKE